MADEDGEDRKMADDAILAGFNFNRGRMEREFFYLAFALLRFTQLPNGNKWEKLPVLRRRLHLRYGSSHVCLLALAFGSLM